MVDDLKKVSGVAGAGDVGGADGEGEGEDGSLLDEPRIGFPDGEVGGGLAGVFHVSIIYFLQLVPAKIICSGVYSATDLPDLKISKDVKWQLGCNLGPAAVPAKVQGVRLGCLVGVKSGSL